MNPDLSRPRDRTSMARRRTGLAMALVAILTVRLAVSRDTAGALVVAAGATAGLVVLAGILARPGGPGRQSPAGGRTMALLALLTMGYAGLGLLLVLGALG
jgi:hypothetical protein